MSLRVGVVCDRCGCEGPSVEWHSGWSKARKLRRLVRAGGWNEAHDEDGSIIDLCPDCEGK